MVNSTMDGIHPGTLSGFRGVGPSPRQCRSMCLRLRAQTPPFDILFSPFQGRFLDFRPLIAGNRPPSQIWSSLFLWVRVPATRELLQSPPFSSLICHSSCSPPRSPLWTPISIRSMTDLRHPSRQERPRGRSPISSPSSLRTLFSEHRRCHFSFIFISDITLDRAPFPAWSSHDRGGTSSQPSIHLANSPPRFSRVPSVRLQPCRVSALVFTRHHESALSFPSSCCPSISRSVDLRPTPMFAVIVVSILCP